jgi:alpha-beta hydrolase superfamily lysophospholipase
MPNTLIKNNTAIVIFHGIGESLSDWINVQKMLAGRGIVSAVFDYGSPADTISGQSGTSLRPLTDDVQDIIDSVRRLCGNDLHLFLLGHSVGNAVLLEMYPRLTAPFVKGVILCNAFSSLKKWLLYHHQISPAAALLFPDYLDNTDNVRNVAQPMLIVHSKADSVNYFEDALEIIRSAEYRHRSIRFVPTEEKDHNYIYNGRDHAGYWAPILHFIDSI